MLRFPAACAFCFLNGVYFHFNPLPGGLFIPLSACYFLFNVFMEHPQKQHHSLKSQHVVNSVYCTRCAPDTHNLIHSDTVMPLLLRQSGC